MIATHTTADKIVTNNAINHIFQNIREEVITKRNSAFPKNALDNWAEDFLRGDLFSDQVIQIWAGTISKEVQFQLLPEHNSDLQMGQ